MVPVPPPYHTVALCPAPVAELEHPYIPLLLNFQGNIVLIQESTPIYIQLGKLRV